mgnify:CR=1 FL=1
MNKAVNMKLVNVGYGNLVNAFMVVSVVHADSAPARRMAQKAKEEGMIIDATQGRKTQSLLIMENGSVVLSALLPETLSFRIHFMLSARKHLQDVQD